MADLTLYDALEVSETASLEEIHEAYRRLAKEYHPDGLPDHRRKLKADAEERTKEINEAWAILKDADKRNRYDALLRSVRQSANDFQAPRESAPPPPSTASPPPGQPPPPQPKAATSSGGGAPAPGRTPSASSVPKPRRNPVAKSVGVIALLVVAFIAAITSSNNKTGQPPKPLSEALNQPQPSKPPRKPLPRPLSKPLAEALNRARVISGHALETITVIAPSDGNWIKVCGEMYIYPLPANVYVRTDGGDEFLFGPGKEIVGIGPSRCLAFRSAGAKPVKVRVHFPD